MPATSCSTQMRIIIATMFLPSTAREALKSIFIEMRIGCLLIMRLLQTLACEAQDVVRRVVVDLERLAVILCLP